MYNTVRLNYMHCIISSVCHSLIPSRSAIEIGPRSLVYTYLEYDAKNQKDFNAQLHLLHMYIAHAFPQHGVQFNSIYP